MKRYLFLFTLFFFLLQGVIASPYTLSTLSQYRAHGLVVNPDSILSPEVCAKIEASVQNLKVRTGVEFAVVVVNQIDSHDCDQFNADLLKLWSSKAKGHRVGMLLLLVLDQRSITLQRGKDLRPILSNQFIDNVLDTILVPGLVKGQYDTTILNAVGFMSNKMDDKSLWRLYSEHQRSGLQFLDLVLSYLTLSVLVMLFYTWLLYFKYKKVHGAVNIRYVIISNYMRSMRLWVYLFPLTMGIIYLYLFFHKRHIRYRSQVCGKCGHSMYLLSGSEAEDAFINTLQDQDQIYKSPDYDLWSCKYCSNYKVLSYTPVETGFSTCPKCKKTTYHVVENRILIYPTAPHRGEGRLLYRCEKCGTTNYEFYKFAQNTNSVLVDKEIKKNISPKDNAHHLRNSKRKHEYRSHTNTNPKDTTILE